ncbi:LysR family transcriptional regulator [Nitrogeniibacter mangrovi]|uniref:LysR family transcriptional regulator n=1 Tax=Nitrogeniibacter mangrovi TaxID=2016596 RepID=A0A6C1B3Y4_9RHOO|nr:LysR family transcriptional regulator [Nitrogeniibacter mangrovi]QID18366.1 LysR family transcriptional regulator [Nitrogeniibacter mangrovi]
MNALEDMRIFVTTLEAGSFTAASDRLGLSKQFVSRRVMALEARLGVRLLNRTTRRLHVTDAGQAYYTRAVRILDDVSDAELAVSSRGGRVQGTLRVSAPVSFGTLALGAVVPAFMLRYPAIRVELDLNDRSVDLVREGYDMAIRIGRLPDSTLVARALASTRMVACCSPAYLEGRGAPATPDDLAEHDCLLYGHGRGVEWGFQVDGRPHPVQVGGRLLANNGELVRDAAIAGLGIAWQPGFIVGDALRDGRLVSVLDAFATPPMTVQVVYPQHRQASLAIRAFTDFLVEALAEG